MKTIINLLKDMEIISFLECKGFTELNNIF